MSYCVNCGVELADSEKSCPLCRTPVCNPNASPDISEKPYPPLTVRQPQKISKHFIAELLTLIYIIPIAITLVCNMSISGTIDWSLYSVFACMMLYVITVPPAIFRIPRPALCIFLDAAALSGFLYFVNYKADGSWFFSFALPLVLVSCVSVCLPILLKKRTSMNGLVFSAIVIAEIGLYCFIVEALLIYGLSTQDSFVWSYYPLITLVVIACIIILINGNKALKEKLEKKFFI